MNRRGQAGMIEEEAKRRRRRKPAAHGRGNLGDRAGIEPFLKNLAEVEPAAHILSIGMADGDLNHEGHELATKITKPKKAFVPSWLFFVSSWLFLRVLRG